MADDAPPRYAATQRCRSHTAQRRRCRHDSRTQTQQPPFVDISRCFDGRAINADDAQRSSDGMVFEDGGTPR